jgi:hypothetical protein
MSEAPNSSSFQRYLAIDAHKHYVVVGGMNAQLEIVLPARRMDIERYSQWAKENLTGKDCVVIDASPRKPSSTIRTFSATEYFLRVRRRISPTVASTAVLFSSARICSLARSIRTTIGPQIPP